MSSEAINHAPRIPGVRVGVIGLGRMGAAIAFRLSSMEAEVIVWNRSAGKSEQVQTETGCKIARDPADLVRNAEIVISSLADASAVHSVLVQERATLQALAGKVLVETSTVAPGFSAQLGRVLHQANIRYIEAPVSGSTVAAKSGQLLILAGAQQSDLDAAIEVLSVLGRSVRRVGAPGVAALCKLALNLVVFGINEAVAEALLLVERGALDPTVFYDVLCDSAVRAPILDYRRDAFLDGDDAEVTFALKLAVKDLLLITDEARALGVAMPQTLTNLEVANHALRDGLGNSDLAAILRHLRTLEVS
jgi:3-hydroxyisobutyrate dehydrogenase-like beta-hydroxyacid dehydrogenase